MQQEIAAAQARANRDQLQRSVTVSKDASLASPEFFNTTAFSLVQPSTSACDKGSIHYACDTHNMFSALAEDDEENDPSFNIAYAERSAVEDVFLPMHRTSNPSNGDVFTVKMHPQSVECSDPEDNIGLNIKGLDKNNMWRSCNVMVYSVQSAADDVFLPMHTSSNPCTGNVFTVKTHHQRVEGSDLGDDLGLNVQGLDKNNIWRTCDVM
eukprot:8269970-Karenia_brevis.AAC.1